MRSQRPSLASSSLCDRPLFEWQLCWPGCQGTWFHPGCGPWAGSFSATTHPGSPQSAGDRTRTHMWVSCAILSLLALQTSVRSASPPGQSSPAFACPAAQQLVPTLLVLSRVAPDTGSPRPQLSARGEQLHPAGSWPHLAPGAHRDTQQPHDHGENSQGASEDLGRGWAGGPSQGPSRSLTPFYTHRVTWPTHALNHWTRVPP